MLYIKFILQNEQYLLAIRQVREVIPYVKCKVIPHAPAYLAGLINYRGDSLPVIDVSQLMYDTSSRIRIGTRIAIVQIVCEGRKPLVVGLLLENVTETVDVDESGFKRSGAEIPQSKYLGEVVTDQHAMLQRINIEHILPDEAWQILLARDAASEEGAGADDVLRIDP